MKMKKLLFILVLFSLTLQVQAQIRLGFKGGLNMSKLKTDDFETTEYRIHNPGKFKTGFHVGMLVRASLFGMYMQPELVYTVLRSETEVYDLLNPGDPQIAQLQVGRLDIPVIAGGKFGPVRLGLGPVASFNLQSRSQVEDITEYVRDLKAMTIGYQAAAGVDGSNFAFEIRYEGNLSKLSDEIDVGGQTLKTDTRASQIIFSLALIF